MNLKDKLNQRAAVSKTGDITQQDLPTDFRSRLQAFIKQERLITLHSGLFRDHYVFIGTTPGNRNAYMSVYLRQNGHIELEHLEMLLDQSGIVFGLQWEGLRNYCENKEVVKSFFNVAVAKGTAVTPGKSGHIELLKRPYNSTIKPDLENFDQVGPEEEIAIIHPPIRGIPGMSVMGEEIPAPAIQLADYRSNSSIKTVTSGDQTVLISTLQGYLSRYNQELSVHSELVLNEDITIHRGNLIYSSDVTLNGNISENVSLNIGGNLSIMGMVSQSHLAVDGNLLIDKGVFGKGECKISVGKNLNCRYLNEVELDCEGNICIEKEIFNSQIWTRTKCASPRAIIIGGSVFAHHGLDCLSLGSELGLKTLVTVGLDKREYRIEHELLPKIAELKEQLARAEEVFPKASSNTKESLLKHISELKNEIESRESEIAHFKEKMLEQDHTANISIKETLFPGVTVMVGNKDYTILEKLEGPLTVCREGDEIRFKKGS
jgi:uncharacterized protein